MEYNINTTDLSKLIGKRKQTIDYWRNTNKVSSEFKNNNYFFNKKEVLLFIKRKNEKNKLSGIICKICGEVTKYSNWSNFTKNHLKTHNITSKEYYDKFIGTSEEKFCLSCGKEKKFLSPVKGYCSYCSDIKCRSNNREIKNKIFKTKLEKYGDGNYVNNEKAKKTCLDLYGDEFYTNREQAKKTTLKRYGTTNTFSIPSCLEKRKKTCLSKYGVEYYVNSDAISESKQSSYREKINKYFYDKNKKLINYETNSIKMFCEKCNCESEINVKLTYSRISSNKEVCIICNPVCSFNSSGENEIKELLNEYNINYIENDRKILDGLELDIYIPESNFAIEFNDCFWHSTEFKNRNYHKNKTDICEKNNIFLLHIFEDQWLYKKDLVISMIKNRLGLNGFKIGARKCKIKLVNNTNKEIFLEENHIQGNCRTKINIGLFYEDELVSLMCFGSSRYSKYDKELLRFCSKTNYNIIGSASKLLSYYTKNYEYENIVSYADKMYSYGDIYETIGFKLISESKPSYFYIRKNDLLRFNRFMLSKKKLGIPDNITEEEHNIKTYFKIFNSGNKVYFLK